MCGTLGYKTAPKNINYPSFYRKKCGDANLTRLRSTTPLNQTKRLLFIFLNNSVKTSPISVRIYLQTSEEICNRPNSVVMCPSPLMNAVSTVPCKT